MNTENVERRSTNRWQWPVIIIAGSLIIAVACVAGLILAGSVGFIVGRRTARAAQQGPIPEFRYGPYQQPVPPERMPGLPDMPGMPQLPYQEQRPWLGVTFQQSDEGARVTYVTPGSPANQAGLQEGDIITAVDGQAITTANPLNEVIQQYTPGDRVTLTAHHNGQETTISVQLASRVEMLMPEQESPFEVPLNPGG